MSALLLVPRTRCSLPERPAHGRFFYAIAVAAFFHVLVRVAIYEAPLKWISTGWLTPRCDNH